MQLGSTIEAVLQGAPAVAAQWKRTSPLQRSQVLIGVANRLNDQSHALALLVAAESTATQEEALEEVRQTVQAFRFLSGECLRAYGRILPDPAPETASRLIFAPLGLCAVVSDVSRPLYAPGRCIASALAAGSALILVLRKERNAAIDELIKIIEALSHKAAVLPVHCASDDEVVALCESPLIQYVRCEGNDALSRRVAQTRARTGGRTGILYEMTAPAIVCRDANPDYCAQDIAANIFARGGALPESIRRIFVARPLLESFTGALDQACAARAPIAPIVPFDTLQEAAALANETGPGDVAYIYTNDLTLSHRLCTDLNFNHIAVNQKEPYISSLPALPDGTNYNEPYGGMEEFMTTRHIRMRYL